MNECIICKHYLDNQFCSSCPLDSKNKGMQGIIKFESIIDEGMTNGEVIHAVFSNAEILFVKDAVCIRFNNIDNFWYVIPLSKESCIDAISREDTLKALTGEYTDSLIEILSKAIKGINALPPVTPEPNRCNQCKYYEGVHNVQGHAPCSFLKCGGVLWDWYCSNYEPYKELSPVTQESCDKGEQN